MATAKPGDPGQAGKLDPKGPNKFEPTTKAKPAPNAQPGRHTAAEKAARDKK